MGEGGICQTGQEWAGRLTEQWSCVFIGQSQRGLFGNLSSAAWWLQSSEAELRGCSVERELRTCLEAAFVHTEPTFAGGAHTRLSH